MTRHIQVVPTGNLGNQMFQLMLARALQHRVPGSTVAGAVMPSWNIDLSRGDAPQGPKSIELRDHQLPFDRIVELVRDEPSIDVVVHSLGCRLEYWQDLAPLFREEFGRQIVPGGGQDDLVINVRGAEILTGLHPNYLPVPLDLYARLLERTGMKPVFVGQLGDDVYTKAIRNQFSGARFVSHDDELGDFHFMRNSVNLVGSTSTYSWLACWLSETAQRIFLPVMGFLHPTARPDIDLVPVLDSRYTALWSDLHSWTGSADELERLISRPAPEFGFDV